MRALGFQPQGRGSGHLISDSASPQPGPCSWDPGLCSVLLIRASLQEPQNRPGPLLLSHADVRDGLPRTLSVMCLCIFVSTPLLGPFHCMLPLHNTQLLDVPTFF